MTYKNTLKYLYGLQGRGMKFGLRNIRSLLQSVDNPERKFDSIHIAGTNGKGSTASFIASVLTESRYATGLYTSPHLVNFTERIRINGKPIPEERLVPYVIRLRPMIESLQATFFEATTCIAFQYFADEKVDVAVVEVGLGGRLDSTNVLQPLVSVITNVSFDHTEFLGNTLKAIAREKGGIIKKGVPCVTASSNPEVISLLRRIGARKRTRIFQAARIVKATEVRSTRNHLVVRMKSRMFDISHVRIGLPGSHQAVNATTALAVLDVLLRKRKSQFSSINARSVQRGLQRVRQNTRIHGRLEFVGERYILDVAHNVGAISTLVNSLSSKGISNLVIVFGVMKDKDYMLMLSLLSMLARHVIAVQPKTKRALSSSSLVSHARKLGISITNGSSVARGIQIADKIAVGNQKVLIVGSHFVVGEALEFLVRRQNRRRR